MSTSTTTTLAELPSFKGKELGTSDWFEITQERVNTFADATDDHQWIHVDVERAKAESPFRGPIGHGFLTLSLFVPMWSQILTVTDVKMGVNYGLNKVRFPSAVRAGSQVRARVTLLSAKESPEFVDAVFLIYVESQSSPKPCCVAEWLVRYYPR